MACPCCEGGGGVNCQCDCPPPSTVPDGFFEPVPGDFNLPCFYPPGPGHGWNWGWCELTAENSGTLTRCGSPFPPVPENFGIDCDGMEGPWKNDPGDGCDDSWIIPEGVAKYAGCPIKVLCGYSSKAVLVGPQVSDGGQCECYWFREGLIYRFEIYTTDCDAGDSGGWRRITGEVLQRNEWRSCSSNRQVAIGAECGLAKPALPFFEFPEPPDLFPCVNDFP